MTTAELDFELDGHRLQARVTFIDDPKDPAGVEELIPIWVILIDGDREARGPDSPANPPDLEKAKTMLIDYIRANKLL
ncbi:MAG: hypothetical protein ABI647_26610 [Gemmatimonadota bacterium]